MPGRSPLGPESAPPIERQAARVRAFELVYEPDLPVGVVIDEAVELAQEYSTKESGRFVHALLARIAEEVRG